MASSDSTFRPIANPYIVGNPIDNRDMFFGREDDFDFIRKRVISEEKGGLLVLCGARRSGKTSILFQIKGGRLGDDFIPVLIDMQSMTVQDDAEFLAKLAQEIARTIDHPEISYEKDYLPSAARNPFDAFQALIQVINIKAPERKLVLMFDEYELIEAHLTKGRFTPDILNLLANWMEHRQGVFIVFTGSDKLETRNKHVWSSFLGKALHRRISFLSRNDTLRLIHEPVAGVVTYAEGVEDSVYRLTAGQPFYTQVLCQGLIDHLNEEGRSEALTEDVDQVVAELIENPLPQMIFSWSSLTDVEKLCLSSLAELCAVDPAPKTVDEIAAYPRAQQTGWRFDRNRLQESLEHLFHHDFVVKTDTEGTYAFKMDLWRHWVRRMHSIWQVIEEITENDRTPDAGVRRDTGGGVRRWFVAGSVAAVVLAVLALRFWPGQAPSEQAVGGTYAVATVPADSGWITIVSTPPGARAYVGDTRYGDTPLAPLKLPVGRHVYELEAPGFRSHRDTVTVAIEDTATVSVTLEETTGQLAVTTSPPGATITLGGDPRTFVSPVTIAGLPTRNRYDVRAELPGHLPATRQGLEITADTTTALRLDLSAVIHDLTIRSVPDSALVTWDGEPAGSTPLVLRRVGEGTHELTVEMAGYRTYATAVSVTTSGGVHWARLEALPPGTLEFMIIPFADIWVDGQLVRENASNHSLQLAVGPHRVRLVHPAFVPYEESRELASGVFDTLRFNFQKQGTPND